MNFNGPYKVWKAVHQEKAVRDHEERMKWQPLETLPCTVHGWTVNEKGSCSWKKRRVEGKTIKLHFGVLGWRHGVPHVERYT